VPVDAAILAKLDPRLREIVASWPLDPPSDVTSRAVLLEEADSPDGRASASAEAEFLNALDDEAIAPSTGLRLWRTEFVSRPDGNVVRAQIIRPDDDETRACVYYLHGGGMSALSCFFGNYRAWAKILAAQGVVVVMIDFRNAVVPSSSPEVAPYPAGLTDCLAGLDWVRENAAALGVDAGRVIVAGESGGGNLTLALGLSLVRNEATHLVKGLYALCPYLLGRWPNERYPSSTEYNGVALELHTNRGRMGYGIEAFEARDPLAWPGFATLEDVRGFPATVVSVNECDPLRDEGVAFYRLLLEAGVAARGRIVLGAFHALEVHPVFCPDITRDTALDLANFASTPLTTRAAK
jgi:acetyl esterase